MGAGGSWYRVLGFTTGGVGSSGSVYVYFFVGEVSLVVMVQCLVV